MSVEYAGTTVIVRRDSQSPAWGLAYLLSAVAVVWFFLAYDETRAVLLAGIALGLYFAWTGVCWLLPGKEVLRFDTGGQLIQCVSYGWLGGRRFQNLGFAEVASVGTDTFKDPRNSAVWAVDTVLRLKDGRRIAAGAPSDVDQIHSRAGLAVEHKTILAAEPHVASG